MVLNLSKSLACKFLLHVDFGPSRNIKRDGYFLWNEWNTSADSFAIDVIIITKEFNQVLFLICFSKSANAFLNSTTNSNISKHQKKTKTYN